MDRGALIQSPTSPWVSSQQHSTLNSSPRHIQAGRPQRNQNLIEVIRGKRLFEGRRRTRLGIKRPGFRNQDVVGRNRLGNGHVWKEKVADAFLGLLGTGGEGGIRTPGGHYPALVFKTSALSHSATSPNRGILPDKLEKGPADAAAGRRHPGSAPAAGRPAAEGDQRVLAVRSRRSRAALRRPSGSHSVSMRELREKGPGGLWGALRRQSNLTFRKFPC